MLSVLIYKTLRPHTSKLWKYQKVTFLQKSKSNPCVQCRLCHLLSLRWKYQLSVQTTGARTDVLPDNLLLTFNPWKLAELFFTSTSTCHNQLREIGAFRGARHTRWIPVPVFEGEVVPGKDKTWLRVGTKLSSSDTRCQDGGTSVKWPWQLNMDQECKEPVKDKTWPCDGTKLFSRAAEQRVSLKRCQNGGTRVKWPWQLNMDQECKVPVKDRVFLCSDYC